jgi:hypothetical protein
MVDNEPQKLSEKMKKTTVSERNAVVRMGESDQIENRRK